ncbi:hypothetical protein Q5P01_022850 [Channa striata]|uniref:C2H2-type domain-containing protein n=1 Tax=Channa striata TaxID=64152 RepID=A0AA88LRP4_CHASR|nr:hypothetical protein Q5P01_022850 [Channa striata]
METCSFQNQVLSVMELLARAAVAEINRQVDDRCAVIRLEVSQSRRDVDLLRRKCEVMEAELRRSRMRGRRKGPGCLSRRAHDQFGALSCPAASRRPSPLVPQSQDRDRQVDAEAPNQARQPEKPEPAEGVERADEDAWTTEPGDEPDSGAELPPCFKASVPTDKFADNSRSTENPADPGPVLSPADGYVVFTEQQLNRNRSEAELSVKREKEEEPDENAAPLDSGHRFVDEEGDEQLWSGRDADDSSFSYAGRQFEPIPAAFTPQSGLHLQDVVPRIHSGLSAARTKRRARTFGCKRPQPDDGLNRPQQSRHPYRDCDAPSRIPSEDLTTPNPAAPSFCGHGRSGFGPVRRMRPSWTSGVGEKRFSCTYCDKSFMRFSQLKEHLRSHTGEKPFSCLQCGRSFTKQCNLIRHAVVHSGEKPYECSLCGKCFTQRSSLKSHQKTAH